MSLSIEQLKLELRALTKFKQDLTSPISYNDQGGPSKNGIITAIENYLQTLKSFGGRLPEEMLECIERLKGGTYFGQVNLSTRAIEKEHLLIWLIQCTMAISKDLRQAGYND